MLFAISVSNPFLYTFQQLAQILPTEENFLLCFRQFVGSSTEFMAVSDDANFSFDRFLVIWIYIYNTKLLLGRHTNILPTLVHYNLICIAKYNISESLIIRN